MIDPQNIKKEFEILNFDPLQLETGNAAIVMTKNGKTGIGKIINTANIEKTNAFEILWYKGEIGKDRTYSLCGEEDTSFGHGKTVYLLETSMIPVNNLICSFKYDFHNNIPDVLNDEINKVLLFKNV
ncbi:hypothetical protein SNE40_001549 [Patella caerulea]|uniref:Uncharacterized protein n=1 Tax=Patella caerulea TaxID=87958 RepID=A0AAN8KCR2_PATCE